MNTVNYLEINVTIHDRGNEQKDEVVNKLIIKQPLTAHELGSLALRKVWKP